MITKIKNSVSIKNDNNKDILGIICCYCDIDFDGDLVLHIRNGKVVRHEEQTFIGNHVDLREKAFTKGADMELIKGVNEKYNGTVTIRLHSGSIDNNSFDLHGKIEYKE